MYIAYVIKKTWNPIKNILLLLHRCQKNINTVYLFRIYVDLLVCGAHLCVNMITNHETHLKPNERRRCVNNITELYNHRNTTNVHLK